MLYIAIIIYREMIGIIESIKKIYTKNNLLNHISLFSIFGIMTICLYNRLSFWSGNIFGDYFGYFVKDDITLYICGIIAIVLFFYSLGYLFNFVNKISGGEIIVPEVSLNSIIIFTKMLPLFIYWGVLFLALFIIGFLCFDMNSGWFYIYYSLLLCFLPFINVIYIKFAKNYEFKYEYFNPLFLFKVLDRTLGDIIFLSLKLLFFIVLPVLLIYVIFKFSGVSSNHSVQVAIRLMALCLSVYFMNILNYIYCSEVVKIIEEKL